MSDAERIVQTRNTREFIKADPLIVRFTRRTMVPNMRGGMQQSAEFFTPLQTIRFVPSSPKKRRSGLTETTVGRLEVNHDRVIALPDADIRAGDEFTREGVVYEITRLTSRNYELVAEADQKGT